ncbi:MAG: competence type IV pilus major pilin ComGC [Phycisphaerales bacterium]
MLKERKAFTLVEVLIVIVILGVLAAVAVPRFAGASDDAKASAVQSTVAGVRSAIATYRTSAVIQGNDPYPTLAQLSDGSVLKFEIPPNPFSSVGGVQSVGQAQAEARGVSNPGAAGWNYYVNNNSDPAVAIFYANSEDATTQPDGAGGTRTANEL